MKELDANAFANAIHFSPLWGLLSALAEYEIDAGMEINWVEALWLTRQSMNAEESRPHTL